MQEIEDWYFVGSVIVMISLEKFGFEDVRDEIKLK